MTTQTIPSELQASGKKERILRAAVDVFARTGYFNSKVTEIAKAAGVADGTIYLYFQGKEDLLISIFREHMRNYLQFLREEIAGAASAEAAIRDAIRFHLETLGRDRSIAVVFQVELRHTLKFMALFSHQELAAYLSLIRELVERGQASGEFRAGLNAQMVAKSIFGILDEMATSWVLSEKDYPLADQAPAVADLVIHGLR